MPSSSSFALTGGLTGSGSLGVGLEGGESGAGGERTLILLNRSGVAQKVDVKWPGAKFRYLETASPQQENSVEPGPRPAGASLEVLVSPGAIVTLTNVELGKVTGA